MNWEKLSDSEILEALPGVNGNFQLLCSFLALLPVAATVKDPLGRMIYANRVALKLYGRKPGEMVGQTIDKIIEIADPKVPREIRRTEKKVLTDNRAGIFFQQLGTERRPIRHSVLKFPFFDSEGDPVLVSIVFPTTPKQLEK